MLLWIYIHCTPILKHTIVLVDSISYYMKGPPAGGGRPGRQRRARRLASGRKDHTPEVTEVILCWNMPVNIHWNSPVNIHWTSDNPLERTTDKCQFVGKCH